MSEPTFYILAKTDADGNEMWQGTFESTDKLLAAIPEQPKLKVEGTKIVADLGNLSSYVVKPFPINTIRPDLGVIDLPDVSVTIPSESGSDTYYGIALIGGKPVACSCPAFQYAKTDAPCKHIQRLRTWPSEYGLSKKLFLDEYTVPGGPGVAFYASRSTLNPV